VLRPLRTPRACRDASAYSCDRSERVTLEARSVWVTRASRAQSSSERRSETDSGLCPR
jgi:hypothetical protein